MSADNHSRAVVPIPDRAHVGLTTYDAKDPDTSYPPIEPLRPPAEAPHVVIVLLDDVGFAASSAFGGPCRTPVAKRLAEGGLKFNRFHTTALCATPAAISGITIVCVSDSSHTMPGRSSVIPTSSHAVTPSRSQVGAAKIPCSPVRSTSTVSPSPFRWPPSSGCWRRIRPRMADRTWSSGR